MLLEIKNVFKSFGTLEVLNNVSFSMKKAQSVGLVGESGSGKSTLIKIVLGLLKPDRGEIFFEGTPLGVFQKSQWRQFRKKTQVVFQNPFNSLDGRMTVLEILEEPLRLNGQRSKKLLQMKIQELLEEVGLSASFIGRLPRELSGGECQRIALARAISTDPELLVCDEPVSSLDLLSQARILNLFLKLQIDRSVAILFVSHDLKVVHHLCDRMLTLKEGEVGKLVQGSGL